MRKFVERKNKKNKKSNRPTPISLLQSLYLTVVFYLSNGLVAHASACAFGFLFSFIPTAMMILLILIRLLHASPFQFVDFIDADPSIIEMLQTLGLLSTVEKITSITNFEIVLGIAIVLMARRFFSSVITGINTIFVKESVSRPIITQLIILALQAIMTITISVVLFIIITLRTLNHIDLPLLTNIANIFPLLTSFLTKQTTQLLPYLLAFIMITLCYKMGSRTKPSITLCIICAALSTATFFLFHKLAGIFINMNRYNMVYGVLSHVIVLLMEVFFFFIIFLFFAEFLFVNQYLDTLILSEMYLLPAYDDTNLKSIIRRLLFIRPDKFLKQGTYIMHYKKGEYIYKKGEEGHNVYYLAKGAVRILHTNSISFLEKGSFFGEEVCLLDESHTSDAIAYSDVDIVRIPEDVFFSILEKNPKVSMKALSRISSYFSKFYGLSTKYPI